MNELDPNLRVNVIALLGANDMEIAFQFLVINNKASKVSTDHIRALALDYKKEELDDRLRKVRLNLDPRYEYVGFADNDDASPFRGFIDWPSNRTDQKIIKPAAIEAAVADIQRRKVRDLMMKKLWLPTSSRSGRRYVRNGQNRGPRTRNHGSSARLGSFACPPT